MKNEIVSSPSFSDFNPYEIPYQGNLVEYVFEEYDYSKGRLEVLLSGSVGSGKSVVMAHCGIRHCLQYPTARLCLARLAMPDLRDTIYTEVLEHLEGSVFEDGTEFKEGVHFGFRDSNCSIWFKNGSEIISRSWRDKKFKKLGSIKISAAIVEQVEENDGDYWRGIEYLRMRVGRLPHIPQKWIIYGANPDDPEHPCAEYFKLEKHNLKDRIYQPTERRIVYFSNTRDNPFLPADYIDSLLEDLDPTMAQRMVEGLWVPLAKEKVYYSYGGHNYRDIDYEIKKNTPIYLTFDFNVAEGKPMSCAVIQDIDKKTFLQVHVFDEFVKDGFDTEDLMNEIGNSGVLDHNCRYIINGDATGKAKSSKSKKSDYDIINNYLSKYRRPDGEAIDYEIDVPSANPPIKTRHNLVNAYCRNAAGRVRLFVYKKCKMANKGMRMTALKPGAAYIEDDSKPYQHITTAIGYHIVSVDRNYKSTSGVRSNRYR